jgi:hypothetical protein
MGQEIAGARKSNGLSILWDMVVAPATAFEALRERPVWLWAFIVTSVLGAIGSLLIIPASEHVATMTFAQLVQTDPNVAGLSAERQKSMLAMTVGVQHYVWIFYPILVMVGVLISTLVMLIVNAIGKGDGNFRRLFAVAMNVGFVSFGISYLLIGFLAYLRGPDTFATQRDLVGVIPSLGWLVPSTALKLGTFLGAITPLSLWAMVLLATGMQKTANIKSAAAWTGAAVLLLVPALLGAAFAK